MTASEYHDVRQHQRASSGVHSMVKCPAAVQDVCLATITYFDTLSMAV